MTMPPFSTVYLAKPAYLQELCRELGQVSCIIGNMVFSTVKRTDVCFALDSWLNPEVVTFESISEAARLLRQHGKYWYHYPVEQIRRAHLITEQLRKLPVLQFTFPVRDEIPPIGCFSLLDKHTLLFASERSKRPPLGDYHFIEDKTNPPNRAYLKLWEALTLYGTYPAPGELAVDLGASPGGWTYVMQSLGARVIAVDKAPLDPMIAKRANISFMQQSAFALEPNDFAEPIDWLLSDVACYPERLYELTQKWIASGKAKRLIFTIKLQGETNLAMLEKFQQIPRARVIHLCHNKHEATFLYPCD